MLRLVESFRRQWLDQVRGWLRGWLHCWCRDGFEWRRQCEAKAVCTELGNEKMHSVVQMLLRAVAMGRSVRLLHGMHTWGKMVQSSLCQQLKAERLISTVSRVEMAHVNGLVARGWFVWKACFVGDRLEHVKQEMSMGRVRACMQLADRHNYRRLVCGGMQSLAVVCGVLQVE